tara:strand:- start:62 stop:469 length:408 start_codon:yes stop_codon:yes gene_type:complete
MATSKRTYPNDYFAWYNDDNRLAIVSRSLSSDSTTTVDDVFDTHVDDSLGDDNNIIRMHYHSKYTVVSSLTHNLTTESGLDSGLHPALIDYVKSRLLEDVGDLQKAAYFKSKYDKIIKQYPHRKTGVRQLAVPKL